MSNFCRKQRNPAGIAKSTQNVLLFQNDTIGGLNIGCRGVYLGSKTKQLGLYIRVGGLYIWGESHMGVPKIPSRAQSQTVKDRWLKIQWKMGGHLTDLCKCRSPPFPSISEPCPSTQTTDHQCPSLNPGRAFRSRGGGPRAKDLLSSPGWNGRNISFHFITISPTAPPPQKESGMGNPQT